MCRRVSYNSGPAPKIYMCQVEHESKLTTMEFVSVIKGYHVSFLCDKRLSTAPFLSLSTWLLTTDYGKFADREVPTKKKEKLILSPLLSKIFMVTVRVVSSRSSTMSTCTTIKNWHQELNLTSEINTFSLDICDAHDNMGVGRAVSCITKLRRTCSWDFSSFILSVQDGSFKVTLWTAYSSLDYGLP